MSSIVGNPGLTSFNLAGKTATFNARNTTAEVSFTNFIYQPAILKLCKAAPVGSSTTPLTASFTLSLVNPLTSYAVATTPINITYSAAGAGCVLVNGPFPATVPGFPGVGAFNLGTQLTVTEATSATSTLTSITSPTGNTVTRAGQAGTITLNQAPANINEIRFLNTPVGPPEPTSHARFDFDGDGKSDRVVFRNGTWFYTASGSGDAQSSVQFGQKDDKLVAADYDGDGKTDPAVFRNGVWFVNLSGGGTMALQFGLAADIPQPGDFDGDGKADFVVFRPTDGNWYMQLSGSGFSAVHFGTFGDIPVAADFDGDGKADPAVYRGNTWYVLGSQNRLYGHAVRHRRRQTGPGGLRWRPQGGLRCLPQRSLVHHGFAVRFPGRQLRHGRRHRCARRLRRRRQDRHRGLSGNGHHMVRDVVNLSRSFLFQLRSNRRRAGADKPEGSGKPEPPLPLTERPCDNLVIAGSFISSELFRSSNGIARTGDVTYSISRRPAPEQTLKRYFDYRWPSAAVPSHAGHWPMR